MDEYNKAVKRNVDIMTEFFDLYYERSKLINEQKGKKIIKCIYDDPDKYYVKEVNGINCSADALISLNRIFKHNEFNRNICDVYKKCREIVVFYFPKHENSINTDRCFIKSGEKSIVTFGDRIDCTLFDIKVHCENVSNYSGNNNEVLTNAYNKAETKKWFEFFDYNFEEIVDYYKIKGIFTNGNYEIYDLESTNGKAILKELKKEYNYEWSDVYYKNVLTKIDEFKERVV